MNTRTWDEITQAIEVYRACPQDTQFDALCRALANCTLYVPVGDFDGNNAVISLIRSAQGGTFLPLYADRANVRPAQDSEGVRPADWQHILSQLSRVEGCVFEPYSVNFAFDRRFVDVLVEKYVGDGTASASNRVDSGIGDGNEPESEPESRESSDSGASAVHAWPGLDGNAPLTVPIHEEEPASTQSAPSVDITVPRAIPSSLNEAMQAVSDKCAVPLWLFTAKDADGAQGYLMVLDASNQWFDEGGAQEVNNVLGRFPDPGARLDFASRESEMGRCVEGQAPHYFPRVNTAQNQSDSSGRGSGFFRRLFKH